MSRRPVEYGLALLVALVGGAVLVFWPHASDTPPPDTPAEQEAPAEEAEPSEEEAEPPVEPPEEPEPEGPVVDASGDPVSFMPPGDLTPGSGSGQTEQINYAPQMRFPLEAGQAYANSQVYGHGGYLGPGGGQCDAANYSYAWRDNFCETRSYSAPLCPSGTGHQGQDIRPATCQDAVHWAVAADDGVITSVGSYSVRLMSETGVRYTYLHLERDSLQVAPGDTVSKGERLGFVSNEFGGTPTTIHLHFEIKMALETPHGLQNVNVPPYVALVDSYQQLLSEGESDHG
ncbi:MAG: peptidase M23 [Oceanicaulis sp.]|uniref:M23 family metallopeptidase n=1 Tax=Oceanicaulis sp. UBA2681 TaxID=1947007 RepID=UPI000C0A20AE|nr:M23 family metallopeptidase [Oceanicaulis sp. UBA2681]MAP48112.1 peptidase M23 [Oceanicaulis sp.]HCR66281.1 M23 family peptidase [Oceanicaulis sp.]|tara:strand:- start:8571 stop:9434 length:864 start_codon:yes stop_codon:yes gene_type:complete